MILLEVGPRVGTVLRLFRDCVVMVKKQKAGDCMVT